MDLGQITQSLGGLLGKDDKAGGQQAAAAGGAAAGGLGGIVQAILKMLGNKGGEGTNGLKSMMAQFSDSGLGDKVQSWLKPGDNEGVSPDEIKNAIGDDVDQVAREAGVDRDEAAEEMSKALPEVVDKLTPNGEVPSEGDLSKIIGQVLGRK
jgi:uncharacterized protein YidB (DUF937 family)